jgi:GntP family gluconate:H+ symporter
MEASFIYILVCLLVGIAAIVFLTAKWRVHPFFALILASFIVGSGVGMPVNGVIVAIKDGFGNIMKSLAFIIVLGTTLGLVLEHTGSTRVMAGAILKLTGPKKSALAMSVTGFIVGLPIFCDSGYIVLSGLNNSIARKTGMSLAFMSVSLATGLYSVHCLIPPHPGAAAAAGIIGVDFGQLILIGILIAIPATAVGYAWARYAGRQFSSTIEKEEEETFKRGTLPSVTQSFLPVLIPILLIAVKAFLKEDAAANPFVQGLYVLGDPIVALTVGLLLALVFKKGWTKADMSNLLQEGAEKAGGILVIIGSGGAFGAVLAATKIGDHFAASLPLAQLGLLFPFLVTFLLKTAQGSSTVAIITAASIVQPLLPALGLQGPTGYLLCVLAMGAGSMMISHTNDAYFWVIAKFSGLEMKPMLRVYSVATILMGITAMTLVYILSIFIN